jgi:hypothetical protein
MESERTFNVWLKTALSYGEVEQLERPENVEKLTEISCIRWDRQGHHPVREEVRRSATQAVDEIADDQRRNSAHARNLIESLSCQEGGQFLPFLEQSGPVPELVHVI